jgi:hypothetical protein
VRDLTLTLWVFSGNFPENWDESADMIWFTVCYLLILFLLVQNFLLAIIVEAYMKVRAFFTLKINVCVLRRNFTLTPSTNRSLVQVREDNEILEIESEFLSDCVESVYIWFRRDR